MLLAGRFLLLLGHEHGGAHGVADLPPVERFLAPLVAHERLQGGALLGRDDRLAREVFEEDLPHVGAPGAVECRETEGDVHARLERLVEGADAVGREEQDAVEVLQGSEEDYLRFSFSVSV